MTLLSRFTGLARDVLMASMLGAGWVLDAFTVAFRLPNSFRRLFGEGAMTAAFLPRFVEEERRSGKQAAWQLFDRVLRRLLKTVGIGCLLGEAVLGLMLLFIPFSGPTQLLILLTMIMIPYAAVICGAALYSAALNAVGRFGMPAFVPVVLNLVWLAGGIAAIASTDLSPQRAVIVALAIVLGGILQLLLVALSARSYRRKSVTGRSSSRKHHRHLQDAGDEQADSTVRPAEEPAEHGTERPAETSDAGGSRNKANGNVSGIFTAAGVVMIGMSASQLNSVADGLLAWWLALPSTSESGGLISALSLPEGTASALYYGQRMLQFPLGILGVALSTVLFPRLARHAAADDRRRLRQDMAYGMRLVLLLGIPASAGLWMLAEPITDLVFRHGLFDAADAEITAPMIAIHGLGVWLYCSLLIFNRVFYAARDAKTPMRHSLICVAVNLLLNLPMIFLFGGIGLPIAAMIASGLQLILAALSLAERKILFEREGESLTPVVLRSVTASCVMAAGAVLTINILTELSGGSGAWHWRLGKVVAPMLIGAAMYAVTLQTLGMRLSRLFDEYGR